MRAGQSFFTGPESHRAKGYNETYYYYHYHGGKDTSRQIGHIFYGTAGSLGLQKRKQVNLQRISSYSSTFLILFKTRIH